jgi:hypothetical protein
VLAVPPAHEPHIKQMLDKELERQKKIDQWKQEKDQKEREALTFSPQICEKSLKKKRRTLE